MQQAEAVLKAMVDKGQTPSIQYLHFNSTTVLHSFAYGYGDLVKKSCVNNHSRYAIYSLTKTFTAIGVLQLSKSGRVELDHPASNYLPAFPYKEPITIRQLLNHTAGIPNPLPLSWIHFPEEQFDRDKFFAGIFEKNSKLNSQPGSKFQYTNLGYVLLGQLIESVSGKSYEEYIQQNILQPLGLTEKDCSFSNDPLQVTGYQKQFSLLNAMLGLFLDKKKYMSKAIAGWKPFHPVLVHGPSYGGLMATPDALVRFGQALLSANPLLDQDGMNTMFTENQIGGKPTGMCLSWFTDTFKNQRYYTHPGGGGGFYVELRLYPGIGKGSILMCNRTGIRNEGLLDRVDGFLI